MSDVTVYMKADSQQTGKQHQHNDVRVVVHEHYLRVSSNKLPDIVINYPFTSIEKWEDRR